VITNSGHEGGICCKFFSQLTEKVPNGFAFSSLLTIDSSVCDVSSEKNKVKGCDKMVFGDFVDDKMAERREGAHISEDCDVYLI
jgi:hypothetical protein